MKVFVCLAFLVVLSATVVQNYCENERRYAPSMRSFFSDLNSRINSQVNNINRIWQSPVNTVIPPFAADFKSAGWNTWNRIPTPIIPHIAIPQPVIPQIAQPFIPDLSNLGQQIEQQVQESLRPLRLRVDMTHGIGGTTVITYGNKLQIVVTNGYKFTCPGKMVVHMGHGISCTRRLVPYNPSYNDVCTISSYSRVNGLYCFGNAVFECINNKCKCKGGEMYPLETLKEMCGPKYGTNEYVIVDYYPDKGDRNAIDYMHSDVCENPDDSHCAWHASSLVLSSTGSWLL